MVYILYVTCEQKKISKDIFTTLLWLARHVNVLACHEAKTYRAMPV